jgi:hypothetical protein
MRNQRLVLSVLALGIAGACAAASDPGPGDDDTGGTSNVAGSGGTVTSSTGTGTGSGTGTPSGTPSGTGNCYSNQGVCNPMEAEGCGGGGACDISTETNQFECHEPPNTAPEGGYCNPAQSSFCVNGLTCVDQICEAYCCTNEDCGGGTCVPSSTVGNVHVKVCALN